MKSSDRMVEYVWRWKQQKLFFDKTFARYQCSVFFDVIGRVCTNLSCSRRMWTKRCPYRIITVDGPENQLQPFCTHLFTWKQLVVKNGINWKPKMTKASKKVAIAATILGLIDIWMIINLQVSWSLTLHPVFTHHPQNPPRSPRFSPDWTAGIYIQDIGFIEIELRSGPRNIHESCLRRPSEPRMEYFARTPSTGLRRKLDRAWVVWAHGTLTKHFPSIRSPFGECAAGELPETKRSRSGGGWYVTSSHESDGMLWSELEK